MRVPLLVVLVLLMASCSATEPTVDSDLNRTTGTTNGEARDSKKPGSSDAREGSDLDDLSGILGPVGLLTDQSHDLSVYVHVEGEWVAHEANFGVVLDLATLPFSEVETINGVSWRTNNEDAYLIELRSRAGATAGTIVINQLGIAVAIDVTGDNGVDLLISASPQIEGSLVAVASDPTHRAALTAVLDGEGEFCQSAPVPLDQGQAFAWCGDQSSLPENAPWLLLDSMGLALERGTESTGAIEGLLSMRMSPRTPGVVPLDGRASSILTASSPEASETPTHVQPFGGLTDSVALCADPRTIRTNIDLVDDVALDQVEHAARRLEDTISNNLRPVDQVIDEVSAALRSLSQGLSSFVTVPLLYEYQRSRASVEQELRDLQRATEDGRALLSEAVDAVSRGLLSRAILKLDTAMAELVGAAYEHAPQTFVYGERDWWSGCDWRMNQDYVRTPTYEGTDPAIDAFQFATNSGTFVWTSESCPEEGRIGVDVCLVEGSLGRPEQLVGGVTVRYLRHYFDFHGCATALLLAPPDLQGWRVVDSAIDSAASCRGPEIWYSAFGER